MHVHLPELLRQAAAIGLFLGLILQPLAFAIAALAMAMSARLRQDPVLWAITVLGLAIFVYRLVGPSSFSAA